MKAAVYHGPGDVRFEEIDTPRLETGEVLLRVRACGICGSDLHTYRHGLFEDLGVPVGSGRVMGHEFSGEIAEINGDIPGLKVGDRICTVGAGGNAEYYRVPAAMIPALIPMPEGIDFDEAATTEPLATSLHAVNLAKPADGETHVIMGAGIIGLGVLQSLKAISSVRTIVMDISDKRLETASQLGADVTVNASREEPVQKIIELVGSEQMSYMPIETGTADAVYDCVGLPLNYTGVPVLEQAINMTKVNGKVVVVSIFEKKPEVEINMMVRKGITLFGSWAWSFEEFLQALELIGSGKIDRKPLITHRFPLEQASEAYETQLKAEEAVKVVFTP